MLNIKRVAGAFGDPSAQRHRTIRLRLQQNNVAPAPAPQYNSIRPEVCQFIENDKIDIKKT
jgi:hypothetical protein